MTPEQDAVLLAHIANLLIAIGQQAAQNAALTAENTELRQQLEQPPAPTAVQM